MSADDLTSLWRIPARVNDTNRCPLPPRKKGKKKSTKRVKLGGVPFDSDWYCTQTPGEFHLPPRLSTTSLVALLTSDVTLDVGSCDLGPAASD